MRCWHHVTEEFYEELEDHDNGTCTFLIIKIFLKLLCIIPDITTNLLKEANKKFLQRHLEKISDRKLKTINTSYLASCVNDALNIEETQERATIHEMIQEECNKICNDNINKFHQLNINNVKTAKNSKAGNRN